MIKKIRLRADLTKSALILLVALLSFSFTVYGQTPWSGVYGNEWLAGKYGQDWLRIGVSKKGVQKISLPQNFRNKQGQLQLFHRGVEVSIISATADEIQFYGIPNDGASDPLLYRPYTGIKLNRYHSWFSDESAYFLTSSPTAKTKFAAQQASLSLSGQAEGYHIQKDLTTYTNDYTHDEATNPVTFSLDQSYFEESKAVTGTAVLKVTLDNGSVFGNPIFTFPFQLKNVVRDVDVKPKFEVLIDSRTNATHSVKTSVGKSAGALRVYPDNLQFSAFLPFKKEFVLNASSSIEASDIDSQGNGVFQCESLTQTSDFNTVGVFSIAYILRSYPSLVDMSNASEAYFNFASTAKSQSRIRISNVPSNARVYDITDPDAPRFIPSSYDGGFLEFMAERQPSKELNLVVISAPISNEKITSVSFKSYDPSLYDYLIVSSNSLFQAAELYASYRNSSAGGSYTSLPVKISDLYNQFNYGEPSPVAIRRFVDFMVRRTPRDKHNLLLMGPSTTIPKRIVRELPEEVPTIGYPGSDVLLVEGLSAGSSDIPTIPVGRISATSLDQVTNYLDKVKEIEQTENSFFWKKNFLHLSGGKSTSEINQLKSRLEALTSIVTEGYIGGVVTPVVKKSFIEVEKVDVSESVNAGVGMISYLGHGSPTVTDLDFGYASDIQKGYINAGKYPVQYYNGCGVGNIFSGRHNPSPTAADRIPVSTDWISALDKGSIAVIANTYYSFEATSGKYLEILYKQLFSKSESSKLSLGKVQQGVAKEILSVGFSPYDVANIHQSLLQGDPAIRPFIVSKSDYSVNDDISLFVTGEGLAKAIGESKNLKVNIVVRNKGLYKKDEIIPIKMSLYYANGSFQIIDTLVKAMANLDTVSVQVVNKNPLIRVIVNIDDSNVLQELRKDNNKSELSIEWEQAKNLHLYPITTDRDKIPPITDAFLGGNRMKSSSIVRKGESIELMVTDNLEMSADTNLIGVYLRPCGDGNCDFVKLSYRNGQVTLQPNGKGIKLVIDTKNLNDGIWELQVRAKDVAGNYEQQSFNILFTIGVSNEAPGVIVWPNPASDYVCFDFSNVNDGAKSYRIEIYNLSGSLIKSQNLDYHGNWYWIPEDKNIGQFLYKVLVTSSNGSTSLWRGKFLLIR